MSRIANTRFSALDLAPIRDDGTPAQALHNALQTSNMEYEKLLQFLEAIEDETKDKD